MSWPRRRLPERGRFKRGVGLVGLGLGLGNGGEVSR